MTFSLRPYQLDAEQQARIAMAGGKRRIVLYANRKEADHARG